jgi:hypothetical protein
MRAIFILIYIQCALGFYVAATFTLPENTKETAKVFMSISWPASLVAYNAANQMLQLKKECPKCK